MSMHLREGFRTGLGVCGQVASLCLFAAPMVTMWRIHKKKDVEEFSVNPYLAGIMNCLMWVFYGLPVVTKNNTLVVTINSVGLVLEIIYVTIYFIYSKTSKQRKHAVIGAAVLISIFALIAGLLLGVAHGSRREFVAGLLSTVCSICLYGMPLDILRKVWLTKSSEYLPPVLCSAGFLNGVVWALYAVMTTMDYFILISNGLGAVLGCIQMIFWLKYRKGPKEGGDSKPEQVKVVSIV